MSLEKLLDEQIKNAIAEGKFDNLKNAGKPLDLDDYFAAPAEIRAGYQMLKDHEFVPEEVGLLKEIGALREKIRLSADDAEKTLLNKKLNERNLALALILERNRRKSGR
ncbi:MAG: DUF1992 domain-containing protein [Acidobacteria bacterium]|nr:DUF1992 domain-containing protein [Acidobacteriota bacterium]